MAIQPITTSMPYDCNMYLLTGDLCLLIDTGSGNGSDESIADIRRILGDRPLDLIILTHCHFDHIGGLHDMMESFGCEAYAGSIDAEVIRKGDGSVTLQGMLGQMIPPLEVSDLNDGDIIDIGEHRLRIIFTPGHTRGSICLYDEVTRSLFSGDTVFASGYGRTDFPTGDDDEMWASLEILNNLNIRSLYPGHDRIVYDEGKASVERAIHMMGGF